MTATSQQKKEMDNIVEADVHGSTEKLNDMVVEQGDQTAKQGGIEVDEADESEQILYMIQNLSTTGRRKTLLKLEPLMSSTVLEEHPDSSKTLSAKPNVLKQTVSDNSTLHTSSGEITLAAGTSRVVIQSGGMSSKLRLFSGNIPVPKGEIDFRTWQKAATRICKNKDVSEEEKITKMQNSLQKPALDLAQRALDSGSTTKVLNLLEKVYGNVDDPHVLLNAFNNTLQSKERASEYLSKLYLLLDELQRRGVVDVDEAPSYLLKQFIYGCPDETLILKLRLEEKELNPPDYGTLLLALRKEEAKRTRKQVAARMVRSQQVNEIATESSKPEVELLRREVASLKDELKTEREKPHACAMKELRQEIAQLKQHQIADREQKALATGQNFRQSRPTSGVATRKKLRFCFKCGLENHTVWSCEQKANPELVCRRFEEAKQQENGRGSE